MLTTQNLIAIDGDGVMLDYNGIYPQVWRAAFGTDLPLAREGCYHAKNAYQVEFADLSQREEFFAHFDERFWSAMGPLQGAVTAVKMLKAAGKRIVCVSSMPAQYADARHRNLLALGMPVDAVLATGRGDDGTNPKVQALLALRPEAFVDDLLHNFRDVPGSIHRAWVDYANVDSPNIGQEGLGLHSSRHGSLLAFAQAWLGTEGASLGQSEVLPAP